MSKPKILAFSGSLRKDSFNQKLVNIAALGARAAGAEVTVVALRDFGIPLYDQDLEDSSGFPESARKFKELMKSHDGFLISSPEHNSSFSAALKSALDWASRKEGNEASLVAFAGKTAGLVSASPGALGGLRGLVHLRSMLGNIQVFVIPDQYALSGAGQAFNEDGTLKDQNATAKAEAIGKRLVEVTAKLLS